MGTNKLQDILNFIREAERLKTTYRTGHTSTGRTESVAEHTWRLCLMALVLEQEFPEVDMARVIKICIVHDLGEALNGDIPAPSQTDANSKAENERSDLLQLVHNLPKQLQKTIVALWDEYEEAQTPEAQTAKALDKMETILQHNQGKNPDDFDYAFNLDYGKEYTTGDPVIEKLRALLDEETKKHAESSGSKSSNDYGV